MFSIGDFARHGRLSVRMLRHYDAIGLLRPAHVDPATGYRRYRADQLGRLNRIVALRDLGFSLAEVGAMLDDDIGADRLREMLALRQAELRDRIAADTERLARVAARLTVIESEGRLPAQDVVIRVIPAVRVAELSALAASYAPADITPVIVPLYAELHDRLGRTGTLPAGPDVAYYTDAPDGGVLVHATVPVAAAPGGLAAVDVPAVDLAAVDLEVVDLPTVEAATLLHRGAMDDVAPSDQFLSRWIEENGHRSAGYARECYLHCDGSTDAWVTELQEPLARP